MSLHWTDLGTLLIAYMALMLAGALMVRSSRRSLPNMLLSGVMLTILCSELHVLLNQAGFYLEHPGLLFVVNLPEVLFSPLILMYCQSLCISGFSWVRSADGRILKPGGYKLKHLLHE
jgi:hypothetical protein